MKKIISLVLVFCMSFVFTVSAQSNFNHLEINSEVQKYMSNLSKVERDMLEERLHKPGLTNLSELSVEEQKIADENVKELNNLLWAMVHEGKPVLIYSTSNDDVYVSVTDGHVEVISYEKENIMTVNGREIAYEQEVSYQQEKVVSFNGQDVIYAEDELEQDLVGDDIIAPMSSYVTIPNPGGSWTYITTRVVDNTWMESIIDIGAGALVTFILARLAGLLPPEADYAGVFASTILASGIAAQTNTLRFTQQKFEHQTHFKTYAYNERALGLDMQGNYVPAGDWFDRYVAWAPNL
ncbi:hypothetical protein Amet_0628 [Alkaliphilus metalliredigens QYMF]|uniref:Uncharacterized protein n=1 Tax=Alkaliphilus metalliredigens (strain QYMF) TaxID=293826 RepID=A6TKY6_ALKMQ|nr:hypothetical protein [Alkaliphilus metalliredigens]ABR46854.1 hypothetical protein Amet_0628 [Alkaliphilus metalliredigens QYMF]